MLVHPDCAPTNAAVYGIPEACDGVDTDCNPATTESSVCVSNADTDGDGVSPASGDCTDNNATVYPGASGLCDGLDTNCSGGAPSGESDTDGDGYAVCDGDCNNGNAAINPGAIESCDGLDSNCSGLGNETDSDGDGQMVCAGDCLDTDSSVNGLDQDGDGVSTCSSSYDCDDQDASIYPGAAGSATSRTPIRRLDVGEAALAPTPTTTTATDRRGRWRL